MIFKVITRLMCTILVLYGAARAQDFITWADPVTISEIYRDSWLPKVVIDSNNNILCVWRLLNGDSQRTTALQFDASLGQWQTNADYLSKSVSAQGAYEQNVAIDGSGNAWAIWRHMSGIDKVIQVSRFEPSSGWLPITESMTLSDTAQDAYYPAISMNQQGTALACWTWDKLVQASINNKYTWNVPVNLSQSGAAQPDCIIDNSGLATVVWQRFDVDHYQIEASSYANGSWLSDVVLSGTIRNSYSPHVAADGKGNFIAVWFEDDNGTLRVYASKKNVGSDWQAVQLLSDAASEQSRFPKAVMNQDGAIIVLWEQFDGQNWRIASLTGSFSQSTWTRTVMISEAGHDAFDPDIVIDSYGSAMATWMFYDSQTIKRIQVARYDAKSTTWTSSVSQTLLSDAQHDSQSPQIAYNPISGQIVVAWQIFDGFNWSIQVAQGTQTHPTITRVYQELHRFPRSAYVAQCMKWAAVDGAVSYAIFGDDNKTLLARIPATGILQFCNAGIIPCSTHTYYIYAVNAEGVYSDPTVVTIP